MTDEEERAPLEPEERPPEPEARMAELEQEVARLKASLAEQEEASQLLKATQQEAVALKERLKQATGRFREALLAQEAEVPAELVSGETVEEIEASLASGKALVERVKRQLESSVSSERIPAGSPARSVPDLSALSPREKIAYALGRA